MGDLPEPPIPEGVTLAGMDYMPVHFHRLWDSDFNVLANAAEFRAAITLWAKAFYRTPAGSLPADDRLLSGLSGAGATWSKIKTVALYGWRKHSDGMLYHPVVTEVVLHAWERREGFRRRTETARTARAAQRSPVSDIPREPSVTDSVTDSVTSDVTTSVVSRTQQTKGREGRDKGEERERRKKDTPPMPPQGGEASDGELFAHERSAKTAKALRAKPSGADRPDPEFDAFWAAYPRADGRGSARKAWVGAIRKASASDIRAGLDRYEFNHDPRYIPMPATWLNDERWASRPGINGGCPPGWDPTLWAVGIKPGDMDDTPPCIGVRPTPRPSMLTGGAEAPIINGETHGD